MLCLRENDTNPCKKSLSFEPKRFDENGVEELRDFKSCDPLERENPEWLKDTHILTGS